VKLVYVHIPKTAGMTLRHVIARQYAGQPVYSFGENHLDEMRVFLAMTQAERDAFACIMGHVHYGIHRYWSAPASQVAYITLLRDPVERTISSYYFIVRNPTHPLYPRYRDVSLLDYASKETRGERQLRYIYGFRPDGGTYGDAQRLPADALDVAKARLQNEFKLVGLVEQFDHTLLLLQKAFGWSNVYYAARNVNERRPANETLDAATLAALHETAEPDLSLYQFAQTLFQQQVSAYSAAYGADALETDVALFRRRNAVYGRAWGATTLLRETGVYRMARRTVRKLSGR
jgi:hypothetical protein